MIADRLSYLQIEEADIEDLRAQGITRSEILEIVALAAFCNFINTWADISQVQRDGGD